MLKHDRDDLITARGQAVITKHLKDMPEEVALFLWERDWCPQFEETIDWLYENGFLTLDSHQNYNYETDPVNQPENMR